MQRKVKLAADHSKKLTRI